jgi:hypothetical protein
MFKLGSGRCRARSGCVLLATWLAAGISFLGRGNPTEPAGGFGPSNREDKLFFALGMIESGNDDRGVGRAGEVSRYQIHPAVWKNYSESWEYQNLDVSLQVARQHWNYLATYFRDKTAREPAPFDMYVLWNTRFGYYARKAFDPARVSAVVRERAQRFVNLVNR